MNPSDYGMTAQEISSMETQIRSRLEGMTRLGLICRDQKANNVLVKRNPDQSLRVVLTDFDNEYCCKLQGNSFENCDLDECITLSAAQIEYTIFLLIVQIRWHFPVLFQRYYDENKSFFTRFEGLSELSVDETTDRYMKEIEDEMDVEPAMDVVDERFTHYVDEGPREYFPSDRF